MKAYTASFLSISNALRYWISILFLPLLLLNNKAVFAGIEPVNRDFITGISIAEDSFVEVKDYYSVNNLLGNFNHRVRATNKLTLEINHDNIGECVSQAFSFWLKLSISKKNGSGQTSTDTVTLYINYDAALGKSFNDAASYLFDSSYETKATIVDMSPDYAMFVKLSLDLEIERYKNIDAATVPTITSITENSTTGDIAILWPAIAGAEMYDLEWTYVDNISETLNGALAGVVNFMDNATRVTVTGLSYTLSPIFDQGYVVFRVRGVGLTGKFFTHRVEGKWSSNGKVPEIPTTETNKFTENVDYYEVDSNDVHEDKLNWQLIATFAEQGKKKEIISYMDGLLRQRQVVTRNNTNNEAMVAEFFYDHVGRQTIQVVPVPAFDKKLKFYDNFNLNQKNDSALKWSDYEIDSGFCLPLPNPQLKTTTGASRYYSPDNPLNTLATDALYRHNGYIPDAKKYPYIRTLYTADPTNRVSNQGGIGLHHQIGGGHETKYLYGVPSNVELDRLFGNNVGFSEHYQKNVVIDPNGQTSISFLDLSGRTIATSLAGDAPDNTQALASLPATQDTLTDDMTKYNKASKSSIYMSRTIVVEDASYYTFDYAVIPGQMEDTCLENVCYDCIYNLTISVTNSCGTELLDGDENTGGIQPLTRVIGKALALKDTACDSPIMDYSFEEDASLPAEVKVWLEPGNYIVSKILTVNDSAADYYLEKYMASLGCKKILDQFVSSAIADIDFSGCEMNCETCESSLGTFAHFRDSLMNQMGYIGETFMSPSDTMFIRSTYEGRIEYCRSLCDDVDPCEAILALLENDILEGGQYFESITVVTSHPEYCHYTNCVAERAAHKYKESMLDIESFDSAVKYGFMDPLGMHSAYTNDNLDSFFVNRTNLRDSAINALNKFVKLTVTGLDTFLTAWEMPVYVYLGRHLTGATVIKNFAVANPMSNLIYKDCDSYKDMMWEAFRAAYLMTRDSLMENKFSGCYTVTIAGDKDRLFEKRRAYKNELNAQEGSDDVLLDKGYLTSCDTSCLSYVDYWLEQMQDCRLDSLIALSPSDSAVYKAMINAMVTVCKKGCDVNNPEGASTVKPGTTTGGEAKSFGDVLKNYSIYKKDVCDSNLLDYPLPWDQWNLALENDTLNCDCFFDSCVISTSDANLKSVLKQLAIDKSDSICSVCLTCEDFYVGFKKYFDMYPDRSFADYRDYEILENVLNRYFRYNLTAFEYFDFMYECAGIQDSSLSDSVIMRKYYNAYRIYDPTDNSYSQYKSKSYKDLLIQPYTPDFKYEPQWASVNNTLHVTNGEKYLDTCSCRKLLEADIDRGETSLNTYLQSIHAECVFPNLELVLSICKKARAAEEDLSTNFYASPNRLWTQFQYQALLEELALITLEEGNANSLIIPTACGWGDCGSATIDTNTNELQTWQNIPCDSIIKYARLRWPLLSDEGWVQMLLTTPDSAYIFANFLDTKYATRAPYNRNDYRDFVDEETDGAAAEKKRIIDDFIARLAKCFYTYLGTGAKNGASSCSTTCYRAGANSKLLKNYLNNLLYEPPTRLRHYLTTNNYYKVPNNFVTYYNTDIYKGSSTSTLKYKMTDWTSHRLNTYIRDTNEIQHELYLEFIDKSNANRFTKLLKFVEIFPMAPACNNSSIRFMAKAVIDNPKTAGADTTWLYGTFDSLNLIDRCGKKLCNRMALPSFIDSGDCAENLIYTATYYAEYQYNQYIDSLKSEFRAAYYKKCIVSAFSSEVFNMTWKTRTYHHTLYYYDQAGNLIQTVPPKGVVPITNKTTLTGVETYRQTGSGSAYYPSHTLPTNYKYNTLNQLVWQKTPDAGESQFWYDKVGRLVVSQNAEQALSHTGNKEYFSYTIYDSLGRIKEVGQIEKPDTSSSVVISTMESLVSWLAAGTKDQITKTYYDAGAYSVSGFTQSNLRSRVSTITIQKITGSAYDQAVHYSYDIHGNVNSMVREIKELEIIQQSLKRIDYDYDLISGNVNKVVYQKGKTDQFQHKYMYDADNRLVEAYTGPDGVHWDKDAAYSYYLHGPLARTELGRLKVQGVDYAYTIHGWLKGVNSTTLDSTRDIGRDADSLRITWATDSFRYNPNQYVAKDVFGYTLGYYASDFSSIRTFTTEKYFDLGQSSSTFYAGSPDLYNGNICRMVTAIAPFMKNGAAPIGKAFKYDQLNRLVSADVFTNANMSGNYWNTTGTADGRWAETFAYDANGNITKLKRRGHKVDTLAMDSLDYYFTSNTNRLSYVDDYVPAGNYNNDIDDQAAANYSYDAIGNLIKDTKEEIHDINWTVYGKIQNIIRITASQKPNLSFGYTPDGHRSIKSVITDSTWGANRSIYVHDAQGNIMAVYGMPTIKLLDTAGLDFEAINNQLLDQIGNTAFANFVVDDLDIVALMAANGNYDVPGDYRTAIYTISGAIEDAMLLTLDPSGFFSANSGLIANILTNDYTGVEVLDVVLQGKTQAQILSDVVGVKYNDVAFHTYLMGMFGNSWLTALYDYNATDFETFYIAAMNNNMQIPTPGQSYAFMENDLTTLLTALQLETELAGLLTSSYVYNAFYAYFSSVDVNQMLSSYSSFKSVILGLYSEADLVDWAAAYDLEKLWTAALIYYPRNTILDWYQASNANEFLKKCVAILPAFVNDLLGNTTMTISEYLAIIYSNLGATEYNQMCAALRETYFRPGTEYSLAEWHLYGSSRLGIYQANKQLATYYDSTLTTITYSTRIHYRTNGSRRYELSNHLGNVLITVSDKRIAVCTGSQTVAYYKAELITATDYYAFGSIMENRSFLGDTNSKYRFTFNGKETDFETDLQDYGMRIYNKHLGKFLSPDPLTKDYPELSPFQFASGTPISAIDLDGEEAKLVTFGIKNAYDDGWSQTCATVCANTLGVEAQGIKSGKNLLHVLNATSVATNQNISAWVFWGHSFHDGLFLTNDNGFYDRNLDPGGTSYANFTNLRLESSSGRITFSKHTIFIFASCLTAGPGGYDPNSFAATIGNNILKNYYLPQKAYTGFYKITTIGSTGLTNLHNDGTVSTDGSFIKTEKLYKIERKIETYTVKRGWGIFSWNEKKTRFVDKTTEIECKTTDLGKSINPAEIIQNHNDQNIQIN